MVRCTSRVCLAASSPRPAAMATCGPPFLKRVESSNGWTGLTRDAL
jgi:hypothetical protein